MIEIYLKLSGSLGTACPASGMGNAPLPVIVRGAPLEFTLKPVGFAFPACDTWTFIFNDRFDGSTAKVIAAGVTQSADGIAVEIDETNTVEAAAWIGTKPAAPIHGELTGFDVTGAVAFRVQILSWTYRNELGSGTPTPFPTVYVAAPDRNIAFGNSRLIDPYGRCFCFDATTPRLEFSGNFEGVARVRFRVVSANAAATGDIVLVPVVDGVEAPAAVLPVAAARAWIEIALDGVQNMLAFRRDTTDARDTLQDGEAIAAIVTKIEVYDA